MNSILKTIEKDPNCALYLSESCSSKLVKSYIASTAESRDICNDPFVTGIRYTRALSAACAKILKTLNNRGLSNLSEDTTTVLHILRGGLNFGIRDAIFDAFGWNNHASAFISAQRTRKAEDSSQWQIIESDYSKFNLKKNNSIILGDVVATGTSLSYALDRVITAANENKKSIISSITFFTIGGPRSHEILEEVCQTLKKTTPTFKGASVIYLEGIFTVPSKDHPLRIKFDGTDLIRSNAILTPEFIDSQYKSPSYPIERCTIYDAGSRAFDPDEYFEDVKDYWTQTLELAKKGVSYAELLKERFPELDVEKFGKVDLAAIAREQLRKIH